EFTPATKTQKLLLGKNTITGMASQLESSQKKTAGSFASLGLDKDVATGSSLIAAPFAIAALTALDLSPLGNTEKKVASQIAKSRNADEIFSLAKPLFKGAADDEVRLIATELKDITDPKAVSDFILKKT